MRISDWSSDVCSSDLSTRTSDRSGYGRPLARLIWHGLLPSPQRPQSVAPSHLRQEGRPVQMLGRLQPGSRMVRARHGRAVDAIAAGFRPDIDDRIADAGCGRVKDLVLFGDADGHPIYQDIAVLGGWEIAQIGREAGG